MRYRRSCKKCVNYDKTITKEEIEEEGPPYDCVSCRRFYDDLFREREK